MESNASQEQPSVDRVAMLRKQLQEAEEARATLERAAIHKAELAAIEAKEAAEKREEEKRNRFNKQREEAKRIADEAFAADEKRKRDEKAEQARLEREAEKLAEELRGKEKKRAEEQALEEKLHALENDNKRRLEELQRKAQPLQEEPKPVTLHSASHPLSRLFAPDAVPTSQTEEIDSVKQAAHAAKQHDRDDITLEARVWVPKQHGPGNCYVNSNTSFVLEKEIKRLVGIQANSQRLDQLSSQWDEHDLLIALNVVSDENKTHPFSHDGLLARLTFVLESCANA